MKKLVFVVAAMLALAGCFNGKKGDTRIINGIECVLVKAGTFTMGSPSGESEYKDDEVQHKVTITQDYWISKYPITDAQYNGSGTNHPVGNVNWVEADAWAKSKGGRLPTEAEWEYAARGGNKSKGSIYSGSNNLNEVGWYEDNSEGKTHPVGQKKPNELGIYDMSGSVWEWCIDWYDEYPASAVTNPTGPAGSTGYRIMRGDSWSSNAQVCRVADRSYDAPSDEYYNNVVGFRVVFSGN